MIMDPDEIRRRHAEAMTGPPVKVHGYVWWCQDEVCDCTQAVIEARWRNPLTAVEAWLFKNWWEGTFYTDGERGAEEELAAVLSQWGVTVP